MSRVLLLPSYRSSFNNEQEAFFEALETVSGSSYYFDGCKSIQRARLMQECFPGTKIFHLVRDPRGFVASSAKRLKKRTGKDPDRGFIDERLLQWRRYNVLAARYEREVPPGDYLRVQYADLLSDPEEVLKRTVAFFGLTEQMPDLGKFDLDRLHVSGNRTNLVSSGIEKRVLGDWRKLADVIDFDYVEKQTRDLPFVELEVEDPAQPAAGAKPTPENA